ncbi:MAG: hypothetical protein P8M25_04460 [Paracoccaceae bacterium]|nr:hypothetical protein [Paracoccaceae bacterium]
MGFREERIDRYIQPRKAALNPAQNQMIHRIKADGGAFKGALYSGFNICKFSSSGW